MFRDDESSNAADAWLPFLAQPIGGHSDEEVCNKLRDVGGQDVELIAPGFISAELLRSVIPSLADFARISPKVRKQMRRR